MQPSPRSVWQVSAGPWNRSYADLCLAHGVALIGPGDAGQWMPGLDDSLFAGSFVRRFASEVKEGDCFLLRSAQKTICAVGIVASDYHYLQQFDEVNGWDLQHARRVRWYRLPEEHAFDTMVFGANPSRFSRVWDPEVVRYASDFLDSPPTEWQTGGLPGLPKEDPQLDRDDVPSTLHDVMAEARRLDLYWDREKFGEHPTEDELIAHLVVPLLRALGWPPERIAIKWRRIDVALFDQLPRAPESCRLVIEVKRLGEGVEGALQQAKNYLDEIGVSRDVIVTDGVRYRMYSCHDGFEPIAYANLWRLKQSALSLFERLKRL